MSINKFPSRRTGKINEPTKQRDGGINNQATPGRRSVPRVGGEPPTEGRTNLTFQSNYGHGGHAKQGVPKKTKHGYDRAAHHYDFFSDRNK